MYRQIAVTAVTTAIAGFAVGAALMGNYAVQHPPTPPAPPPAPGITGDIPGVGDTTRAIGTPLGDGMCRTAGVIPSKVPVIGQIGQAMTVTATAIDGVTGANACP